MISELVQVRKRIGAIAGTQIELLRVQSEHVLAFRRPNEQVSLIVVANFSEKTISLHSLFEDPGVPKVLQDQLSGCQITAKSLLAPYEIHWLTAT